MTIDQFIDQAIRHEDYMLKCFADAPIGYDMNEAYETALEVAKSAVYHDTGWNPRKMRRMEDDDFINAASDEFYETYVSVLHDLWVGTLLDEATDDAKQKFITYIFRQGSL